MYFGASKTSVHWIKPIIAASSSNLIKEIFPFSYIQRLCYTCFHNFTQAAAIFSDKIVVFKNKVTQTPPAPQYRLNAYTVWRPV